MPESQQITLRQYENRRLYDVTSKQYVTVEQVRDRLVKGEHVYSRGGDDVTARVLVTLITRDQKHKRYPPLTAASLRDFVRSYLT